MFFGSSLTITLAILISGVLAPALTPMLAARIIGENRLPQARALSSVPSMLPSSRW